MSRRTGSLLLAMAILVFTDTAWAKPRTWTDNSGRTVKGDFVRVKSAMVVLKLNNGTVKSIPFANFSEEDQAYVRELVAGTDAESELPAANAAAGGNLANGNRPGGNPAAGAPGGAVAGFPGAGGIPGPGGAAAGPPGSFPGGAGAGVPGGGPGAAGFPGGLPGRAPIGPPGGNPGVPGGAGGMPGGMAGGMPGRPGFPGGMQGPPNGAPGAMSGGFPNGGAMPGGPPAGGNFPGAGQAGGGLPGAMAGGMPMGSGMPAGGGMPRGAGGPGMNHSLPGAQGAGPGIPPAMASTGGPPRMNGGPGGFPGGNTPGFNAPQMQFVEVKQCLKCKKEVPATSKAGDRCPHCGVYWSYEEGKGGSRSWSMSPRAWGKLAGLAIVLCGAIGVAVKKAMS